MLTSEIKLQINNFCIQQISSYSLCSPGSLSAVSPSASPWLLPWASLLYCGLLMLLRSLFELVLVVASGIDRSMLPIKVLPSSMPIPPPLLLPLFAGLLRLPPPREPGGGPALAPAGCCWVWSGFSTTAPPAPAAARVGMPWRALFRLLPAAGVAAAMAAVAGAGVAVVEGAPCRVGMLVW